ncbi:MAG TPA: hypothetical protein VKV20_14720 [Ktedonobacteraceae bacterium]|jgi:ABC-type siderophore export system fused ATPase/permease subunit|nr:hypothetical protein [Ktedonobacteraceae bacterium]
MSGILGLPPLVILVIVLGLMAYLVYHMVSTGTVEPVTIIILLFLGFILIWALLRLMHRSSESETD